ncbi:S-adenosyl-L-methionine-dependent methyltransferase [Schizophyllum amplum]|uniref:S-adenosyl-L-methionine-dependent methyltransferase n=1 Tax=Schizophyllum amplum TaxID=97359 RepID=A0A550CB10_9AGAR|nr:S-adenosyl-L-methionine-dependent methyltransferase [Auriculariopsis ampla]
MSSRKVQPTTVSDLPQTFEDEHVHGVYDEIASHFSSTRYKPWPVIASFLSSLPAGAVGLDSGTGNGKYLPLPLERPSGSVWTIGLDRSRNLLAIARGAGEGPLREVVWGDALQDCWRSCAFDYAISIATIHHLATEERRRQAVEALIRAVSSTSGRVLIYVWAVEQDELSKREVPSEGRVDAGVDVFVPWVLQNKNKGNAADTGAAESKVYNRYYHMFARGELRRLAEQAAESLGLDVGVTDGSPAGRRGLQIVQDGWERSNYYVELQRWCT